MKILGEKETAIESACPLFLVLFCYIVFLDSQFVKLNLRINLMVVILVSYNKPHVLR